MPDHDNLSAVDTPVRMSHLKTFLVPTVFCPDCRILQLTHTRLTSGDQYLECPYCDEKFELPMVELERRED